MARAKRLCDTCNREIEVELGQTTLDGQLIWSASYQCPFCGSVAEIDDFGFPPDDIRPFLLLKEGMWELTIEELDIDKVLIAKVIRQALNLNLVETTNLLKELPGKVFTGTKVETEWMKQLLEKEGIATLMSQKK